VTVHAVKRRKRSALRGSRAERSPAKLKRSAALRGRAPGMWGAGEENHSLWNTNHAAFAAARSTSAGVR
jgi:hypothetical protein